MSTSEVVVWVSKCWIKRQPLPDLSVEQICKSHSTATTAGATARNNFCQCSYMVLVTWSFWALENTFAVRMSQSVPVSVLPVRRAVLSCGRSGGGRCERRLPALSSAAARGRSGSRHWEGSPESLQLPAANDAPSHNTAENHGCFVLNLDNLALFLLPSLWRMFASLSK